ncbi:M20 family metallopeptidase [Ornithinimicrobium sufpigmenti]|uniref:M20 family metallopeptidase n=1 Tax=Ornithinimicrobium sufpigmenti TaxID=2508882 RepID=UPI0010365575|nr:MULTISPECIES: M20 family metallopeptidase [unclassified Ornithinimicrobium]
MDDQLKPSRAYLDHLAAETTARMESVTPQTSTFTGAAPALSERLEHLVEGLREDLVDIVRTLHADPETAFEEHRSVETLARVLRLHGAEVSIGTADVPTAFRAEVGNPEGPTIAVLSEYDALPEVGHACGHNVIAATGVGAFLGLAALLREQPEAFPGRVVLLGTPAEEGHSGKELMARGGAFDDIDAAIMVHPYGYDVADQVWLGRRLLTWTFHGVPAHASAQPFMGRNALDAASLAYQAVGLLRQQLPPVDRVHAVITSGGTRPSVITEQAEVRLYARSKYPDTLKDLSRRLDDIARGAALMTGTRVDVDWDEHAPSLPVRTNGALTERWVEAQRRRGRDPLPGGTVSETIAASTDFGNVSYRIPGIHPLIKIAPPEVALHTRGFAEAAASEAARDAAVDGAVGLALTALDYLCDAELRTAVHENFERAGGATDVEHYFD